jgi:methionyl-tRNA synthetase
MTYFTAPIYYVNDAPHVGHAYSTVIADALARWERLRGRPARLVTGTDEHGAKVARAAAARGLAPQVLADETAPRFVSAWDRLGIGYDDFVRTTSARHRATAAALLSAVYDAGHVRPGRYDGRYCVGCEAYVATEVCAVHGTPTEVVSEDNWFFALSSFAGPLASWLDGDVVRPVSRRNEALGWLRRGLEDFSISRASLTWGVPLPWDPTQVAYVWFDALAAYLTGGYRSPAHHVIGKDILRFHAIWWPAILLAADLPLPSRVTVHGFLLQRGGKIAKSTGGAFVPLDTLLDTFGADGLRYGLLRGNPIGPDGEFTVAALAARYNADLANTLGNLVSRLVALVSARHAGVAPTAAGPPASGSLALVAAAVRDEAGAAWDDARPSDALAATWRLVAATNAHLVAAEPWRQPPGSPRAAAALGDALEALRIAALLASPAIPSAAAEIARRIGDSGTADLTWGSSLAGQRVSAGPPLFPRLRLASAQPAGVGRA